MKIKFGLILLGLLLPTALITAQMPLSNSPVSTVKRSSVLQKLRGQYKNQNESGMYLQTDANNSETALNCDDQNLILAPTAAPCNGVSVTSINFNNASRTVVPNGTANSTGIADKNVGVVYKYANAGTAPDGTAIDAYVTVISYANNQDATPTTFTDADVPSATIGFDQNLQPNINQESLVYDTTKTSWTGNIHYQINFYAAGTTTPKRLTVAAISIDNDGATQAQNTCGALQESVTYNAGFNQILIDNTGTTQIIAGSTVTGPFNNQANVGVGSSFANSPLFVNVNQLDWTYAFNLPTMGTAANCNGASPGRYGSLNMSCQITFDHPFATTTLSGNVYNDANGLSDSTVNGTGTGTPGGTQLYANLVDANGFVFTSVAVNADGTYLFPTVVSGSYTVQISTTRGVDSNAAPAIALPAGWVSTGENLGAAAGNDGTVNGSLPVTIANTAITNANFGIEQPPTAAITPAASQANPGGTTSVTVPAATFATADTTPGTVSSIRISAFPSNATSITINGTNYTSANFPAGGVTVPVNAAGNPTQPILVDPVNGAVTVAIPFFSRDNAGFESLTAGAANVPFSTLSISGNVFNDNNGLTDSIVNGTGTNAGGLFANLLDSNGNVVQSVAVPAGGTYSFAGLNGGNYSVQISTNAGTVGSAAPATALPAGWVNTGENVGAGAGNDGTANGVLPVTLGTTNVTNANFGINQRPTATANTAASQVNPGGTNSATVPATTFSGTDPVSGSVSNIRITSFPSNATSITINGTTYTSATFPAGGVTVPTNAAGNPTQAITVDPVDGAVTVVIPYVVIDAAGLESSTTANASVPFTTASLSGNVFNDLNGLTDSIVNGTGTNAGGLFANLLDSNGNVVQSVAVPAGGTYSFAGLNGGNYSVQISTNAGTVGSAAPATALPAGWVNTGENVGAGAGNDGTANGLLAVTISNANVTNANFGIEQRPTANANTAASQTNQGGTVSSTVPPTTFSATDPVTNSVSSIRITAFPTGATSITINGTTYTSATFPAGGVTVPTNAAGNPTQTITVDPSFAGAGNVVIPYVAIDGAGIESSTPANATVPFTVTPTAANATVSGRLFNGDNPLADTLVTLTDLSTNTKKVVRTDASGEYSFDAEVGKIYNVQPLSSKYTFDNPSQTINLTADAAGLNFNSSAKKYHPKNDFDGDGKSDVVVFRASEGKWFIKQSSDDALSVIDWGKDGDVPVSADFDGDGKTDAAVFRPSDGNWYILQSKTQKLQVESFGQAGDKAMPADFDGDGKADVAVYRDGLWYVRQSSDNAFRAESFGLSTDIPFVGDVDGDGKSDFSVYRAESGMWYSRNSADYGFTAHSFGLATDTPILGDFDGDGRADIGQFRDGSWYQLNSTTDFEASRLGQTGDQTFTGDFDGDGRTDTAVYRGGNWTIRFAKDGSTKTVSFGLPTDTLVK